MIGILRFSPQETSIFYQNSKEFKFSKKFKFSMREGEVVEDVDVGLAGVCEGYVREGDIAGHGEGSDGR